MGYKLSPEIQMGLFAYVPALLIIIFKKSILLQIKKKKKTNKENLKDLHDTMRSMLLQAGQKTTSRHSNLIGY